MMHRSILLYLAISSVVTGSVPAFAATVNFHADLGPTSEVPRVADNGSGTVDATLNTATHKMTYDISFQGFTSQVTMAHFHGPADATQNAPVVVPLGTSPSSPLHGTITLTAAQQQQLLDGKWYANIHTSTHPKGAARGQLERTSGSE